jgi:hippurate hydrolase
MVPRLVSALMVLVFASISGADFEPVPAANLTKRLLQHFDETIPRWRAFYEDLHAHPELSFEEVRTSGLLAHKLRELGWEVTEHVGRTGVVGVFRHGEGPCVLVRTDMDALPVQETTGLPYASTVQVRRPDGSMTGVMHACGHDMHMTCWLATAEVLTRAKEHWSGTLIFVAQPAEEIGKGALAMIDDKLFERFGKPDVGFALHCESFVAHGDIGYTPGYALANVDTVDVVVKGRGGHGAHPQNTIDPIVITARIILDLQTIVSREVDPLDAAVITVGSVHGGTKHNIIPSEVRLQLTVRSFKDATRARLLDGIRRVARGAAQTAGAPEPEVIVDSVFTPALFNDEAWTEKTVALLRDVLGKDRLVPREPVMGGEDFSRFSRAGIPCVMLRLGTIEPDRVRAHEAGQLELASLHSEKYFPVPDPSIRTGTTAMVASVLQVVGKKAP